MEQKKIVIIGGSSGIGKALAYSLKEKHKVIVCGRNPQKIDKINHTLPAFICDVSKESQVIEFKQKVEE